MGMIWCGGEDLDFPNGRVPIVSTDTDHYRTNYSRCAIGSNSSSDAAIRSKIFEGGEITSGWISCRFFSWVNHWNSNRYLGFGKSGTEKGIFICIDEDTDYKTAIYTYDGSTMTRLDYESGASLINASVQHLVMQLTNYGASSNIKVWVDNVGVIDWTGDSSISGVTGFDSAYLAHNVANNWVLYSEVEVSDEDLRTKNIKTLEVVGDGDATEWEGDYSDIDEKEINDSDLIYSNTSSQTYNASLSDCPEGDFSVGAAKISIRATSPAGSTADKILMGFKSEGSVDVGSTTSLTTSWETYERIVTTVNGSDLTTELLDAIQLHLQSSS
jgi:hypothetical protein